MKNFLTLSFVALSLLACSSEEELSQQRPGFETGAEVVFDGITTSNAGNVSSRASDINFTQVFSPNTYAGMYFVRDDRNLLAYKNKKYLIGEVANGRNKITYAGETEKPAYPINPSIGYNILCYYPYQESPSALGILNINHDDIEYPQFFTDLPLKFTINYGDQLTEGQYREHDLMTGILTSVKENSDNHYFTMNHLNCRIKLTLDLSAVPEVLRMDFMGATLGLLHPIKSITWRTDNQTMVKSSVVEGNTTPYKILEISDSEMPKDTYVTYFCVPPFTMPIGHNLFRITFPGGAYRDFSINTTKAVTFKENVYTSATLKIIPSEVIFGAKLNNWSATVTVTGTDPEDIYFE